MRQQTAVINVIRAHLAEFGIVAPVGRKGVIGPKRTKLDFGLESRRRHDAFKKYWSELTTPTANAGAVSRPRRAAAVGREDGGQPHYHQSPRGVSTGGFPRLTTRSMRLPHDLEHGVVAVLFGEETARVLEAFLGSEQALASGAAA
jgi:hypothetical protein